MTKSEYMNSLQEKLENFGKELQEEILEDYRQHFAEGQKQGRTEEEIIEELGNVEEMIRELTEMEQGQDPGREYREIEREKNCTYVGEYKAIELTGEVADISLEPSEGNQILVEYRNNGSMEEQLQYEFYQYEKDGVFFAGVKRRHSGESQKIKILGKVMLTYQNNFFRSGSGSIELEVKVPRGMQQVRVATASGNIDICGLEVGELQCKASSGDIDISSVRLEKIQLNSLSGDIEGYDIMAKAGSFNAASGDIRLDNCRTEELACSTASGDIEMEARTRDCRCSTASGDMDVKVAAPEQISCSTGSGDMRLELKDVDGVEFKVGQGSGDVEIFRKGKAGQRIGGGTYTYGNGACKAKVSVGSGDMELYI